MTNRVKTLQPGLLIGDLQINEILGIGTFGITYLVTDPLIGTRFALKEYLPGELVHRGKDGKVSPLNPKAETAFATGLEQFLLEARLLATLDHPNIVRILRYFESNGTAYILMPFYQGRALHQWLESGDDFSDDDVRELMLPLMDGLEYIHQQGVVHQDIKPANIFMTRNHGPVLLDFGVAAAGDEPGPDSSIPASTESVIVKFGSEGYAALEQSAREGPIGPWTDIYALAATLYRCVSGNVPTPASQRLTATDSGSEDPLIPVSDLLAKQYPGGIIDAITLGLALLPKNRPRDIEHWKKSFESLDWRRSINRPGTGGQFQKEDREWLPRIALAIFILLMSGIGIYLLFGEPTQWFDPITTSSSSDASSGADTGKPAKPVVSTETLQWQTALKADTILAYRRFMNDYPDSGYNSQAQLQLNILDEASWLELSAENTELALKDYLELFPAGIHQAEALQRIDVITQAAARQERQRLERQRLDKLAWENASNKRTVTALGQYISAWPAGQYIEEAKRVRRVLQDQINDEKAYEAANNLNTSDAYQAYINAFPKGENITAALQYLDKLDLRPGKNFKDCATCPDMKVLPAGTYWQGSLASEKLALSMEKPRRQVTINNPFAASVNEVSMAQWDECFANKGCEEQPADNGWGRGSRPVIMVSWTDAQQYVRWLSEKTGQSYRLPSESEWEYFARAGEQSDWLGGDSSELCGFGNIAGTETGFDWQHKSCADDLTIGTAPAGSFKANAFGLHDVIGNVSEWTSDCLNLSYVDAPVDGSAWGRGICSSHMTRGGSWLTGSREIRLPARFNLKNGDRNDFTGFRVVRDIED